MTPPYLLAICTDFYDDLHRTWFDKRRLRNLLTFFRDDWGMTRVYWMYSLRHEEGLFGCLPDKAAMEKARRTRALLGEFLPAAVEIAHELDMECYSTYKPFDLGFSHQVFPRGTPAAEKHGKLDCLSGTVFRAANGLVRLRDKRLERHPADVAPEADRTDVATIRIDSDQEGQPPFDKQELALLVSTDNAHYRPYAKPYTFRHDVERGDRVVYLEGLRIREPFLALESRIPENVDSFGTTLDKLIALYDEDGGTIPFSYGLDRNGYRPGEASDPLRNGRGFAFDNMNQAFRNGYLRVTRHAINNRALGCLGLARGRERYICGFLSPAYPEVRDYWLGHVRECLDAGVDGVDIRVQNHNKCLEWERYGFGPPVVREFKRRHGIDITTQPFSAARHRALLGEFYTAFVTQASTLVRSHGKRLQVHIGPEEMLRAPHRHYMNLHWDWEGWIDRGLVDAITIKDRPCVDEALWTRIARHSRRRGIPAYFCPRVTAGYEEPHWVRKWRATLDDSIRLGQNGLMLYESATHARIGRDGRAECAYPGILGIIQDFRKAHGLT